MLNNICKTLREYHMVSPGETVVCCVSGGADSMALLFALYLLAKKLNIQVSAAHFNHGLRGEESSKIEIRNCLLSPCIIHYRKSLGYCRDSLPVMVRIKKNQSTRVYHGNA